jgi:DNA polymerase I-like protein with 3'-5' exonuclease and polymerase domains
VPVELLREYNEYDCTGTYQVYLRQRELLKGNKAVLFRLHCDDLLVLEEMEFNGLLYDSEESLRLAESIGEQLKEVYDELRPFTQGNTVNWNSPKQCSAVLYGGSISFPVRESTRRVLKDGSVKQGERWGSKDVLYVQLVEPIEKTKLADGTGSTDEATLRSLKPTGNAKALIKLILKVSELDKLKGTYYEGMPKIIDKMEWPKNMIHGNLNQCVTKTGRTASSKPNVQNMDPRLKPLFYSRYE